MHPPAQSAVRGLDEETTIGDFTLNAGNIFISIYDTHKNANYWPEPDKFDPTRFEPEKVAKQHPGQYLPFGGFSRTCLGESSRHRSTTKTN